MSWIMVDIEADGPIPGDFSMIEIGAVVADVEKKDLSRRFSANLGPIPDRFVPEAFEISGYTRGSPATRMRRNLPIRGRKEQGAEHTGCEIEKGQPPSFWRGVASVQACFPTRVAEGLNRLLMSRPSPQDNSANG